MPVTLEVELNMDALTKLPDFYDFPESVPCIFYHAKQKVGTARNIRSGGYRTVRATLVIREKYADCYFEFLHREGGIPQIRAY